MNEILPLPHHVSLTNSGELVMGIILLIVLYTAWRWSYLGRTFQKGARSYFFFGILAALLATLLSFGIVIATGIIFLGTSRNTTPVQNAVMTGFLLFLIVSIGYAARVYLWKKFKNEHRDEIDEIGHNQ